MSNGDTHETINLLTFTPLSLFLAFAGYIFGFSLFYFVECVLFWVHSMFHTYYVTPDNDAHSKSTKRLGLLGKIIGCKSSSWECLCVDCSSPRGSEECREFREHNNMSEDWVE